MPFAVARHMHKQKEKMMIGSPIAG